MSPQNTAQESFRQSEIRKQNAEHEWRQSYFHVNGSDVDSDNYRDPVAGPGLRIGGTGSGFRASNAALAGFNSDLEAGIRDKSRILANFEKEYGAYTAKQDAEAAARARAELPLQHARADAYRKELLAKQAAAARATRIEVIDGAGASFNGPSFASGVSFDSASAFGSGQGTPSKMDQPGLLVRLLGGASATQLRRDISPVERDQIIGTQRLSANLTTSAALVAATGPFALEAGAAGGAYALTGAVNTGRALYYGSRALALDVAAFGPLAAYRMNAAGVNATGLLGAELTFGYDAVAPSVLPMGVGRTISNIERTTPAVVGGVGSGERMVMVYRGTNLVSENMFFAETGHLLSDAGRQGYAKAGSTQGAYSHAGGVHQQWIDIWGSEGQYVEAHGAFGIEMPHAFGLDRTFLSVTTDLNTATRFAGNGGVVYGGLVPESALLGQTLAGAGEREYLIRLGTDRLQPLPAPPGVNK